MISAAYQVTVDGNVRPRAASDAAEVGWYRRAAVLRGLHGHHQRAEPAAIAAIPGVADHFDEGAPPPPAEAEQIAHIRKENQNP